VRSGRSLAALGGAAFLLLGVLGFVPGATTHYGELQLAYGSHAQLLGVFRVSILLNMAHLLVGAGALVLPRPTAIAIASLGLWLLGALAAGAWLSLDTADNWLHFVAAVALLGSAFLVRGEDLADDLERNLRGRLSAEV
jgi:hypothetical protein